MKIIRSKTYIQYLEEGESVHDFTVADGIRFTLALVSLRNRNVDSRIRVTLAGSHASATIVGIIVADGDAAIKLHTMQIHDAPDTTSNLLVKTALSGHANCTIDGGIRVEKNAQKTDAYQRNENLLLSEKAYAESKPSLEILANDVRCTHGATVGPVSAEEVWYLAARGIPKEVAQKLIVSGFFRSVLDLMPEDKSRGELWQSVESAI